MKKRPRKLKNKTRITINRHRLDGTRREGLQGIVLERQEG